MFVRSLFSTFPSEQGGNRKPVFVSSLSLIAKARGHICHIHCPLPVTHSFHGKLIIRHALDN